MATTSRPSSTAPATERRLRASDCRLCMPVGCAPHLRWVSPPPSGTFLYGRGHSCVAGGVRRRRGRESCPRTRRMAPVGRARTRPRGMSPSALVAGPAMAGRRSLRYGRRWWRARTAPELTSRPPRRPHPIILWASQEDIDMVGDPVSADGPTPSRARPNGARWCGRGRLSVSCTRRGALSAPDLPDITQVTARNRLKMPQIPRRDL